MKPLLWVLLSNLFSQTVPFLEVENIAVKKASSLYGMERIDSVLTYYDLNGRISAYAFVFDSATVVVSADSSQVPILECFNSLPPYYTNLNKAKERAEEILGKGVKFERIIYIAPLEEWFEFSLKGKRILINSYSLKMREPKRIQGLNRKPSEELRESIRDKWERVGKTSYIKKAYIEGVPALLWSYGCSPTASAMIMWYWDIKGYGRLVDYFFDRYDYVVGRKVYNLPNVQQELARGMQTDSMTGSTAGKEPVVKGHIYVANHINDYSFQSFASPYGDETNGWVFDWIKREIDAGRPCHWAVFHYFPDDPWVGHSLCAIGYEITSDTMIIVHTTWDTAVHYWPLWVMIEGTPSYDWVVTLIPGGGDNNDIRLLSPEDGELIPGGLPYRIRWESEGGDIERIELKYTEDGEFYPIASLSNQKSYVWKVIDDNLSLRINIMAYDKNGTAKAGDGIRRKIRVKRLSYSGVVIPSGHCQVPGEALDVYKDRGFAYVASGNYGFSIVDISDPTLPFLTANYPCSGYAYKVYVEYPYLYLANGIGGLRIFNVSDPYHPEEISHLDMGEMVRCVIVRDSLAYLGADKGVYILNISNPAKPSITAELKLESRVYALSLNKDSLYLGCGGQRVIIVDVENPSAPEVIDSIKTQGPVMDLRLYGGWLYIAEASKGVEIWNPDTSILLNTEGQAKKVYLSNDYLYIADGEEGMGVFDISSPLSPVEKGRVKGFDRGTGVFAKGRWALFTDGTDGLYIITNEAIGVEEVRREPPKLSLSISPNPSSSITTIEYYSPEPAVLSIYDVAGRTLYNFNCPKGDNKLFLNRDRLPSGIYFVRMETGKLSYTKKLILIK